MAKQKLMISPTPPISDEQMTIGTCHQVESSDKEAANQPADPTDLNIKHTHHNNNTTPLFLTMQAYNTQNKHKISQI